MPRFAFDLDTVREHLPDKLYQRGEGYAAGGRVSVIGLHGGRVVAQIDGESGRHTVEVNEGDVADSVCSCPAFDDWGLCKHMAALALAANALDAEAADAARGRLARLQQALELEGVEALAARLIALAKADPDVLEALESLSARRIAIIGISGSGKSHLARRLAARTGLPLHHMDTLFWRGAWEPVPEAEYLERHKRLVAEPAWIIEGYVDAAMAGRLREADQVIWLDYSGPLCAWRTVRRWLSHRVKARPELPEAARERLSLAFFSVVIRRAERPAIKAALQGVDPEKIQRVTSPAALRT